MNDMERPSVLHSAIKNLNVIPNYSKYKPKINLEILTSRKADTMLVVTYFMFFACLSGSLLVYFLVYEHKVTYYHPNVCLNCTNISLPYTVSMSFTDPPSSLLTLQLETTQSNYTSLIGWNEGSQSNICSPVSFDYEVSSWACFNNNGCTNFTEDKYTGDNTNQYFFVGHSGTQSVTTDMCQIKTASNGYSLIIMPTFYHFQVRYYLTYLLIIVLTFLLFLLK